MKVLRQLALMLVVVLPLMIPTMVCALPNAHLSPAERACCRHMSGQCESGAMTSCQGCCQPQVPTADNWNAAVQSNSANHQVAVSAVAEFHSVVILLLPVILSDNLQSLRTTLPQSPPSTISVLRL